MEGDMSVPSQKSALGNSGKTLRRSEALIQSRAPSPITEDDLEQYPPLKKLDLRQCLHLRNTGLAPTEGVLIAENVALVRLVFPNPRQDLAFMRPIMTIVTPFAATESAARLANVRVVLMWQDRHGAMHSTQLAWRAAGLHNLTFRQHLTETPHGEPIFRYFGQLTAELHDGKEVPQDVFQPLSDFSRLVSTRLVWPLPDQPADDPEEKRHEVSEGRLSLLEFQLPISRIP